MSKKVNFNSFIIGMDQNSKNMEFSGKLKSMSIQNLCETYEDPVYFVDSVVGEQENVLDLTFSMTDSKAKSLYQNSALIPKYGFSIFIIFRYCSLLIFIHFFVNFLHS